jgi:hypothetical protein
MPKQRRIERKAAKAAAKTASVLSKAQLLHSQAVDGKGFPVWRTPLKEQQSMFFSKLFPGE